MHKYEKARTHAEEIGPKNQTGQLPACLQHGARGEDRVGGASSEERGSGEEKERREGN